MNRSQIGGTRFVRLRPECVEACDGNPCAALLLDVFDYRATAVENGVGEDAWTPVTMPWLSKWLGGGFGSRALRTALELLVEKGYVDRRKDPTRKLDQTWQYRLNAEVLIQHLAELRSQPSGGVIRNLHARASDIVEEQQLQEQLQVENEKNDAEPDDLALLWATIVDVWQPPNKTLTASRKRVLSRALIEAPRETCERAVYGCAEYATRTGRGTPDVRRVFVTYPGGSPLADQIQWWADQASSHQPKRDMPPHVAGGLTAARDHHTSRFVDGHWTTENPTVNAMYAEAVDFACARYGLEPDWQGDDHRRLTFRAVAESELA